MKKVYQLHLTVKRPDAAAESLVVTASRVLVGTGAHCDVRISGLGAAREHLALELEGATVFARALATAPPPFAKGKALFGLNLGGSGDVAVAGTRISFHVAPAPELEKRGKATRRLTTAALALVLTALPGIVYGALRPSGSDPIGPPPSDVTPLFGPSNATCPSNSRDEALAVGARARAVAEREREQHPFAVRDGLHAVESFRLASACLRKGGHEADAASAERAGEALQKKIEGDYQVHRVRLEHALDEGEDAVALREVRVLGRLTVGRKGPYIDWLDMVERRLVLAQPKSRDD